MAQPFFTIGHSTRPVEEFVDLLRESGVQCVANVRTVPRSRTNPQYNQDQFPSALAQFGIGYEAMPALGGLRGRSKDVSPDVNGFWENQSFHNYADYALTPAFHAGLDRLRTLGHKRRTAVMCAEAVWWRCHRRLITDYLIAGGEQVFHILGRGHVDAAHLTEAAHGKPDGSLTYPAAQLGLDIR